MRRTVPVRRACHSMQSACLHSLSQRLRTKPPFRGIPVMSYPPTKKRCPPTNGNCGEGGKWGGYGAKSPQNEQMGNYGGSESRLKKRESKSDEAAVFILPGPIQISTRPPAPPSPNHPPSMHPVNYDEPDHDQMVAEDQRDTTSAGGSATKRHHAENNQDDDGKCQKTERASHPPLTIPNRRITASEIRSDISGECRTQAC